jgi:hypothetical protein
LTLIVFIAILALKSMINNQEGTQWQRKKPKKNPRRDSLGCKEETTFMPSLLLPTQNPTEVIIWHVKIAVAGRK